jgi:hypothetical protein
MVQVYSSQLGSSRMRANLALLVMLAAACGPAMASVSPAPAPLCRPSDELVTRTLANLRSLVTINDTLRRAMRDSLRLSATRTSDVSYVTDEKICVKAAAAMDALWNTGPTSRQVYVYKFGTDYIVEDPTIGQDSEYRGLQIFDRRWVYKRTYLSP